MLAPAKRTGAEDLVDAMVASIRTRSFSQREIKSVVQEQIDVLARVIAGPPSFGKQADNRRYADEIRRLVRSLLRKFDAMPEGTLRSLSVLSAYARETVPRADDLDFDRVDRFEQITRSALEDLESGAQTLMENKIGDYHTLDRTKHFCAATAYEILVGLDAEEPTNGDPFRFIANSLFQIVVPNEAMAWRKQHKEDPDLRAQCEKVLANWRKEPDRDQQHRASLRKAFAGMIADKSASSM